MTTTTSDKPKDEPGIENLFTILDWFRENLTNTQNILVTGLGNSITLIARGEYNRGFADGVQHAAKKPAVCRSQTPTSARGMVAGDVVGSTDYGQYSKVVRVPETPGQ